MTHNFWENLKRPVMVLAPMSGISDEAFRLMFLKYGKPDVFWTEFVSVDGLLSEKGRKYCFSVLKFMPEERPIVAQIFGGKPANFEKAAEIIVKLGFDGIDINMGCPDRDIEKSGGGAALIKNPDLAKEIIRATKKGAGKMPVSVKTRIGYGKNQIAEWIPVILKEDIATLTVHFRTKKEMYTPPAHWESAKEVAKLRDIYAPKTLIIGNGDVKSITVACKLIKETGLDGVMFGRSVLGNPWFFSKYTPTVLERLGAVVEHAKIFSRLEREPAVAGKNFKQFESMKKHFHAYTKGFNGAKDLRESLMKVKNVSETEKVIESFLKNSG
jgi:nifR3 family TIM-barrel protein